MRSGSTGLFLRRPPTTLGVRSSALRVVDIGVAKNYQEKKRIERGSDKRKYLVGSRLGRQ